MKTVLLIEDNSDIRENMGEIMELAGYNVLLAPDGMQGVKQAAEHLPDIIICDIMMPELDGYGVIHMLQKNDKTKHIPFIFLTAKAERSEMRRGMEMGADDYITKPFSGTELLAAIESRLKKAADAKREAATDAPAGGSVEAVVDIEALFEEESLVETYRKKQVVYTVGNHPTRLYRVKAGKVKAYKTHDDGKDLITSLYGPGDFLGYVALLEGKPQRETAEALEDSELESLPREAFERLMRANPGAVRDFIKLLAGNVAAREEQLLGLAYNSLRKKVAEALMALCRKYKGEGENQFAVRISRENLASIAATAKESLIRTLGDFRSEGLIDVQGSDIVILDERRLAGMAN